MDDETVIRLQRPVLLNGIDDFVERGDLADRSILLDLPQIPAGKRRCEDEFWSSFHHSKNAI